MELNELFPQSGPQQKMGFWILAGFVLITLIIACVALGKSGKEGPAPDSTTVEQLGSAIKKIESGETVVGKAMKSGELVTYVHQNATIGDTGSGWRWDLPQRIWVEANDSLNWHLHPDPQDPTVVKGRVMYTPADPPV